MKIRLRVLIAAGAAALLVQGTAPPAEAGGCPRYKGIKYGRCVVDAAKRYRVPPSLVAAVIYAESGFNKRAKSKVGALGLMQLMPATARGLGLKLKPRDERLDPKKNIYAGTKYLAKLMKVTNNDVEQVLSGYSSGPMYTALFNGVTPASRRYVRRVLKYEKRYRKKLGGPPLPLPGPSGTLAGAPAPEAAADAALDRQELYRRFGAMRADALKAAR